MKNTQPALMISLIVRADEAQAGQVVEEILEEMKWMHHGIVVVDWFIEPVEVGDA